MRAETECREHVVPNPDCLACGTFDPEFDLTAYYVDMPAPDSVEAQYYSAGWKAAESAAEAAEVAAAAARYRQMIGADLPMAQRRARALRLLGGAPTRRVASRKSNPST